MLWPRPPAAADRPRVHAGIDLFQPLGLPNEALLQCVVFCSMRFVHAGQRRCCRPPTGAEKVRNLETPCPCGASLAVPLNLVD